MLPQQIDLPVELRPLAEASVRIGADVRLAQAAGGNLSVKSGATLWIKASGTRLSEAADRQIFVPMDLATTREAVLVTEDLAGCVLPEARGTGLRPSIETALHALLPHATVIHAHGVGTIAAGLTSGIDAAVRRLPGRVDVVVVPYAKPGVQLARAVLGQLPAGGPADRPLVVVLRNHGLVVGAADCDTALEVLDLVEDVFRTASPPGRPAATGPGEPSLCPPGTVDDAAARVLCAGALTPDSAVFLGPEPFGRIPTGPAPELSPHAAFVADDGSVWLRPDLGPDEREVALSLVDVARQVRGGDVSTLTPQQVDELVNWEAEKWRRQQKR